MRAFRLLLLCAATVGIAAPVPIARSPAAAVANDNRVAAGVADGAVLRVSMDVTRALWYPDGDSLPGVEVDAFAEAGKPPSVPGPLLRLPAGTEVRVALRNLLVDTVTFHLPPGLAEENPADSLVLAPGESGELHARPSSPGNHAYHATTTRRISSRTGFGWLLSGALVVDPAGTAAAPDDRVLVIQMAADSLVAAGFAHPESSLFAINGRSWPHTERLDATAGDTLRWKVINASADVHPMHLHGFYFRVDAIDGVPAQQRLGVPGRLAVTERLPGFSGMAMTWVAERAGNWLFHCHMQAHVAPHRPLGPAGAHARRDDAAAAGAVHANHALTGMSGLVMGIRVHPREGDAAADAPAGRRRLRVVAVQDPGFPNSFPSMRFLLEEQGHPRGDAGPGFSPAIHLRRGEPVSITVVNRLTEPTAVHWHGIELESFHDGVPGFGGYGARVTPVVMPRDSFEARFTPPRSGTFLYHSHVDEARQHRAGLLGALIVADPPRPGDASEHVFFIKATREGEGGGPRLEINGSGDPDTLVLRMGQTYRLRFIGLQVQFPNATAMLTARPDSALLGMQDSLLVQWRSVAKDGADLPAAERRLTSARQIVSMGETYDFEFVPERRGSLRLEVRVPAFGGRLLARVPVRVE